MYKATFLDNQIAEAKTWAEVADFLLSHGLAKWAFGTLFTMNPGVTIRVS